MGNGGRSPKDSQETTSTLRHTGVRRVAEDVIRDSGPWSATVLTLLRHLEQVGFTGAPRVVGSGFDASGRETITSVEGDIMHPGQPTVEGAAAVGQLLKALHEATRSYQPPTNARWQPSFHRDLGDLPRVIGHGDPAPWNIVTRNGLPYALIDWEFAGPTDPLIELAHACWLNANLYDDDIPERDRLPPLQVRAQQIRTISDSYGLSRKLRHRLFDTIVEFAIHSMANDADEANVTQITRESEALWGLAWKARSIRWMLRNGRVLRNALA